MSEKMVRIGVTVVLVLWCGCQKQVDEADRMVKIGGNVVSKEEFEAFRTMKRMYPRRMEKPFPGGRSDMALLVETELLFKKARFSPQKRRALGDADWKWKQRFFPGQLYLQKRLARDLGIGEKRIESFYEENKQRYRDTIRVRDTIKAEAATADSDTADSVFYRDSVTYKPLSQVRAEIVQELFLEESPPDKEFWEQFTRTDEADSADSAAAPSVDTAEVESRWIRKVRGNLPDFFLRKRYRSRYGEPLPEELGEIYGEGNRITPEDLDVILSWIPEQQRDSYRKDTTRITDLVHWLLRWELFSSEAKATGFAEEPETKYVLEWAEKLEVANAYVGEKILPEARTEARVDTAMCLYEYWDRQGRVRVPPDTAALKGLVEEKVTEAVGRGLDKRLYGFRREAGVEFFQTDWTDGKEKEAAVIEAEADSLLDSGSTDEARKRYTQLVNNYGFMPEGKRALAELAKIQSEKEQYRQALKNYREYLIMEDEPGKRCNVFFMVGFIYDEYMDKPELAEVNYKWVLKNTPDCELADDAEFMCLHLAEPMTSVENLRAEAIRQGRDVGEDEEVSAEEVPAEEEAPDEEASASGT